MTYLIIIAAAVLAVRWAVRELDPNARTPAQARREAIDAQEAQAAGQPVHDDSRETADV
jgi:hypothetical protein